MGCHILEDAGTPPTLTFKFVIEHVHAVYHLISELTEKCQLGNNIKILKQNVKLGQVLMRQYGGL